jgi:hypothetical protein
MDNQQDYKTPNYYMEEKQEHLIMTVTTNTRSNIIKNQNTPNAQLISNLSRALKSKTSYVNCPFCNHQALTRTTEELNITNLIFFIITLIIGWLFWQCIRRRDYSCYNVHHYCRKCNTQLSDYSAC